MKELVDRAYLYMQKNHLGKDRATSREAIAKNLGIDLRTWRHIRNRINKTKKSKIAFCSQGTYMVHTRKEMEEFRRTCMSLVHDKLEEVGAIDQTLNVDGQLQFEEGKYKITVELKK